MTQKYAPAVAEITTRNSRQLLRSVEVRELRHEYKGILIYGLTAAKGTSTEFTGFLKINTQRDIVRLVLDLLDTLHPDILRGVMDLCDGVRSRDELIASLPHG